MRGYRNYTLEEIEQDRVAYRHIPAHAGKTYTEVKAARARRWRAVRQAAWVLAGVALMVSLWVMR